MNTRRTRIYEGKAKILYEGPEPGTLIVHYKDDATAFNAQKKAVIDGKGVLNNRISELIFTRLNELGMPTHFLKRLNMREQLVREVEIIPLEVVVRNVAAGSLAKRLGIEEGTALPRSIIEFYYKNDQLHDPMVSEEHITAFNWATPQEIDDIMHMAIRINDFLSGLFLGIGIKLVDFKVEFGRLYENDMMRIVLADEISPDSCRLWDIKTQDKLDKDRFRRDMGGLVEAYQEVARRLGIMPELERARAFASATRQERLARSQADRRHYEGEDQGHPEEGVLDPQGKAIEGALGSLGFSGVEHVRQGKYFEIDLRKRQRDKRRSRPCATSSIANTVIENYEIELACAIHRHPEPNLTRSSSRVNSMKSAVIVFPGINRERDMMRALEAVTGDKPVAVWHADTTLAQGRSRRRAGRLLLWRLSALRRHCRALADHDGCPRQGGEGPQGSRRLQRLPDPHRGRPPARRADAQFRPQIRLPRR